MTDRYAVMGHPVAHSKSPFIHARFAAQTGQAMRYEAIDVAPGGFARAVEAFRAEGGRGLNVTLPFKEEAWRWVRERTPRAQRAGAVNTIWFDPRARGDNTDGAGLVHDIEVNHGGVLAGRRILLLGAGGAARGVLGPLLDARPGSVVVANRTARRAHALAEAFADQGPVRGCGLDALGGERFELVVNATSASLSGELPAIPDTVLAPGAWCYDMVYGDTPTVFMAWARGRGASTVLDGLGMLVEQAAESFEIWRGVRPHTAPVIAALRAAIGP